MVMKSTRMVHRSANWLIIATLPAVCLFPAGCANTLDGRKTQAQGTGIGAIAGGALGYALGGSRGAAMGALIGGGLGMAYGTSVANRKAKYARAEQWLDQEILIARQANSKAYAYNRSLKTRLASIEQKVSTAKAVRDKAALHSLKSEISRIHEESRRFEHQQEQASADLKLVAGDPQARAAQNYNALQKEADAFNEATAERGRLLGRLASLQNSIDR
jgi:hypothetical protein